MKSLEIALRGQIALLAAIALIGLSAPSAFARSNPIEAVQRNTEAQVRRLVEPLIDKYCQESCKLLAVTSTVDTATPDQVAPGFDEIEGTVKAIDLAPSSARIKLLIDDKVGPVSRQKLTELIQQFLDTLEYPVKIDTQLAHFPQPIGTENRVTELREKVIKQFRGTMDELFAQFCPEQCLLADFNVLTDTVNPEEAQYGKPGEFIQDGGVALKIREIQGTILVDSMLSKEEQNNILEMAKLKSNVFRNVTLAGKSMRFPHPEPVGKNSGLGSSSGRAGMLGGVGPNGLMQNSNSTNTNSQNSKSDNKESRSLASTSDNKESKNLTSNNKENTTAHNSTQNSENNLRQERFERIEKIERVESGDAVQAELAKFKVFGLVFACAVISLLVFLAMASYHPRGRSGQESPSITRIFQNMASDPLGGTEGRSAPTLNTTLGGSDSRRELVATRYEIERLTEELTGVFAQYPKVAKQVFSRVLTEEGIETTSQYLQIFGESVVMDMLRDPSLQSDLQELMEFYAKNPSEPKDEEKLELLRKLHNRTVAGKLLVMGNRSSNLFDFLAEMDGMQILELVRAESLTVKSIVLTQVDPQKRSAIYSQLDEETRMKLLTELSRIDYLPRDYIFNVANALKRKRKDNPRLNTEALPGSEVLVNLLERTGVAIQRSVVKNLEISNPDSARTVKGKLVSIDTLRYLRDGQLLEVVLSLRHDELLQFLKGAPAAIKQAVFAKSPKELIVELEEELVAVGTVSRESYSGIERKVLNRMKMMATEGLVNLVETNERMFSEASGGADPMTGFITAAAAGDELTSPAANIKKVAGW